MEKNRELYFSGWGSARLKFRKMKLTGFLLLLVTVVHATGFSQATKISVRLEKADIREVIQVLEEKTTFIFLYKDDIFDFSKKYSLDFQNENFEVILKTICDQANVTFEIHDRQILLKEKLNESPGVIQQQRKGVSGVVTGPSGDPLPGVTVLVKETTIGTVTDSDGKFQLDIPVNAQTLVFSFIGMKTVEVPVGTQTLFNVSMEEDILGIDEVVVVGYGTQKKSDVTGTVTSLPRDRLEMVPNLNITQAIQGAVPGVIVNTSRSGAQPDQTLLVRGRNSITANNDPLIIVDGIPYGGNISDINPNDIQSLEILKDASAAAIYGSRGANGVILITSKEGTVGKTTVTYEGNFSVTDVTKVNRMLTGPEFYEFKMTRNAASMTQSEEKVYNDGTWTNWTDLALRTGYAQEHNVSVSGGFKDTKYYISGGITDIKGVALNDNFQRISSRINIETKLTDWLSIGTRTQLNFDDESGAEANFHVALETNPLGLAYDEFGNYTIFPWPDNIIVGNPLGPLLYDDLDKTYQILANNYAIVDIPFIKGLSYRLNNGVRFRFRDRGNYQGRDTQSGLADLGDASIDNGISNNTVLENILSYNREFGGHTVFFTGLYSYEGYKSRTNSLDATKFPNDFLSWYGSSTAAVIVPDNTYSKTVLVSQMLRLNYSFASRYLATLTVRRDGYSGFGADTKWGVFPSAALGWNLANEEFFPFRDFFSQLKLRASYGMNGNQAIGAYESLPKFVIANMSTVNSTVIGYKPARMGVSNLGWESSTTFNLGFDYGLLDNRISGNFNWYLTNTSDLLLARSISVVHGITEATHLPRWVHPAVTENIGKTRNTGVEVVIDSRNVVGNKFTWSTSANFSFNKNEIVSLYGMKDDTGKEIDDVSNGWFIGKPVRVNYDYVWDGVWQIGEEAEAKKYDPSSKPGYVKLKDINNDGVLDAKDRQVIGQLDPKVLWGMTNTFTYDKLTLSIFMHGVHGSTVRDYLMNDNVQGAEVRYNTLKKNWWTPNNPTNDWVANDELANNMSGASGRIYEKPDFVRIKDVVLSYDLPQTAISKIGLSRLRVFLNGRNLVTFTKWPGMDPDLVDEQAQQRIPMQKEYRIGVNLGF